ncbi:uncharacterized protein LOC121994293 [Zingiber officinale]|uniref:Uncharacterized protein n=1 Tax=Zingiber officinale TaxID=94328 RepID=A0A8J5L4P2_ZINOF|nr:uncharacterized protein LOC121994293 [Zingiber officinale]KAG6500785.1 hypothetical protein ZIOFF_040640 [Zingiber officinale]
MEKCRSFPASSSSAYSSFSSSPSDGGGFGYDNRSKSYSFNGPSGATDPEQKRKRRIASYNSFAMERKLKSSLSSSFKWIKNKFSDAIHDL